MPRRQAPQHARRHDATRAAVSRQLRSLAQALDNALNAQNEPGTERKQYVFNMLLVRARDIYGFHEDERVFIKVVMCAACRLLGCITEAVAHS